jgi:monofunctional chorismate mutase
VLGNIRSRIDKIDDELVRLFAERLLLAEEVANIKREKNIPVLDSNRESEIIGRLTNGKSDALAEHIKKLFSVIFEISRTHQAEILAVAPKPEGGMTCACECKP